MHSLTQAAHAVSPLAAGVLFASVWQGLLLTLGVAIALRVVHSITPATRTMLWTAVLVLVLALPALAFVVPHTAMPGHKELHVAQDWSVAVLGIWAFFSMVRGVRLMGNAVRLLRLARRSALVPTQGRIASLLDGRRRAQLCVSPEVDRPSVAGFFRPRVLLPVGLMESLSPAELEHVVLHEMEHLRRYDDWLNLLQQVGLTLLPLNPALVWLDWRLCQERELACDDGVLQATQARKAYAACLVRLAEDSMVRRGVALALSALGSGATHSDLVGRVQRILAGPERKVRRAPLMVGAIAMTLVAGAGLLARSPEWVSFDVVPEMAAQMTVPAPPVRSAETLVTPTTGDVVPNVARPLLAKASMDRPIVRRIPAVAVVKRKARMRSLPARAYLKAAPWMTSPALEPVVVPTRHVVLTEFEESQPMFAAVPWRDGWLILQL